ncbi:lipase-like isoform X2 [Ananas comosus]|nr:lipase-like isoform X2 [Ananas comosus]XP_020100905.1 lipase-like isoform X2 [Ananas comosus]XP_020100906.1 lipase-like isoform X2 [Ananas comosus]XP_020100907.1 lipase-like isoform X2 [Ananas comosus]XP_020100908.1 lipase-like isoform X2 [Ananas comosus]XP_020100909.1 lipase-like isoform X2 [Ananas comosus]
MIELIVDVQNCLQAFVGFSHDLNSIIVAFRGTQKSSIRNWIEDLYWKQLDLHYPGMPEAMVHCGFYSAYHNTTLRPEIINAVQSAMKLHGDVRIIVTGHSMGGALAAFCALDLTVNYGIQDIQVMTFGQPRVGNAAFASYFHKKVPQAVRVTNGNDIVPHLPPYYSYFPEKTYHHFPREVWLHEVGIGSLSHLVEEICDGSGEDDSCSRSVYGDSISDHLNYFGVELRADARGSCKFIIHNSEIQYDEKLGGDVILLRNPTEESLVISS